MPRRRSFASRQLPVYVGLAIAAAFAISAIIGRDVLTVGWAGLICALTGAGMVIANSTTNGNGKDDPDDTAGSRKAVARRPPDGGDSSVGDTGRHSRSRLGPRLGLAGG